MKKIGILGYGNMGKVIAQTLNSKLEKDLKIFIFSKGLQCDDCDGFVVANSFGELIEKSDVIFLCIKPQDFQILEINSETVEMIKTRQSVFVSIMAGVRVKQIEEKLFAKTIIRTMPNLPLQVGRGVVGWFVKKDFIEKRRLDELQKLLSRLGLLIKVEREEEINAITAISGSGPAYVFLFLRALTEASVSLGFSPQQSREIAIETVIGSSIYAQNQKEYSLNDLIGKITSKGGTTEAALKEIDRRRFDSLWIETTKRAYDRAEELSN